MFDGGRMFKAIVIVSVLAASSVIAVARAPGALACIADNDGDCYRSVTGTVTATAGLNVRAAPYGTVLDTVPYNYSNSVDCYVQASDGSYWDWLYDTRIGRSGWVYDPYLYTGGNIYQQVDQMNEGNCGQWPLTTPANVSATAVSSGSIRVTWTDTNGGGAQYVVNNGNVSSANLAAGSTSYTWGGLAPGTYMCFAVAAKANGGQSPWSGYACATTWKLSAPANVKATVTSTSSIRVTWSDTNGGAAQYVVGNGNTSSADLAAGATSYTWGGLAAGTYMCFTVAAKQSGQQGPWSAWACATTPTYVNMGDSFSSGEGTYPPYLSGSNTSTDKCHRSGSSYSGQFAGRSGFWHSVINIACSGAVTNDIFNPPGTKNSMGILTQGEPAQNSVLNSKTGLVTITIGGNNLNLAGIFTNCIQGGEQNHDKTDACFHNSFSDTYISEIPGWLNGTTTPDPEPVAGPTLAQVYANIKKQAPNARIVVSTYPQIFPAKYTGNCTETILGVVDVLYLITSQDQLDRIHRVISALNSAIRSAAQAAGLTVLDEENKFAGHEVCTSSSWVNQVNGWTITNQVADQESLHPTTAGYNQWANDLKGLLG
jgi:hypothetical protein